MTLRDDLKEIASAKASVDEAFITLKDILWHTANVGLYSAEFEIAGLMESLRCDQKTFDELLDIIRIEELAITFDGPGKVTFHWR